MHHIQQSSYILFVKKKEKKEERTKANGQDMHVITAKWYFSPTQKQAYRKILSNYHLQSHQPPKTE